MSSVLANTLEMPKTKEIIKKDNNCPICADHFTPVIRQAIACSFCAYSVCRPCVSRYLLSTINDPHCMNCKIEWNNDFIDKYLTKTFRTGDLKLHRRKVLIDRERSKLPSMQVFVEAQKVMNECNRRKKEVFLKQRALRFERKKAQEEFQTNSELSFKAYKEKMEEFDIKLGESREEYRNIYDTMRVANRVLSGKEPIEVRHFVMKCPADECRGFLSTAWKCGTCQKFFCSDCHVEKGGMRDEAHVCNEEAKATASLIQKETHPCPKCGVRIYKIDGCDQMWCVSCHTTFSWKTGQIEEANRTHNPHYYEYLRRNNGSVPREAGDIPCGGLPGTNALHRKLSGFKELQLGELTYISNSHRCLMDLQDWRLRHTYPIQQNENRNKHIDIRYLMGDVTEERWGKDLERIESEGRKSKDIGLILQTLLHVGAEKLTGIFNSANKEETIDLIMKYPEEMKQILEFTNESLVNKSIQSGYSVPQITEHWMWVNPVKFKKVTNRKKARTDQGAYVAVT